MSVTGEKAVPVLYLDLDGTVRHGKDELGRFVNSPDDVVIFPEAITLMRQWKRGGGRIVGVSNQGGIALGHVSLERASASVRRTWDLTKGLFDHIGICPHHPSAPDPTNARCWCRKPRPGLLIQSADILAYRYGETYPAHLALMVGDRDEDQQAAGNADVDFQWAHEWRSQVAEVSR